MFDEDCPELNDPIYRKALSILCDNIYDFYDKNFNMKYKGEYINVRSIPIDVLLDGFEQNKELYAMYATQALNEIREKNKNKNKNKVL